MEGYANLISSAINKNFLSLLITLSTNQKYSLLLYRHISDLVKNYSKGEATLIDLPFQPSANQGETLVNCMRNVDFFLEFFASACKRAQLAVPIYSTEKVDKVSRWAGQSGCHVVLISDDEYPQLLKEIDQPPPIIFIKTSRNDWRQILASPSLAIVGSRQANPRDINCAKRFASHYARQGWTIVSGLAHGIDSGAHQGAIACGQTISVSAHSFDLPIYPASNRVLAERIMEHGILLSEFAISSPPYPQHFPQRNRIIAGLCYGTIVLCAKARSGSLITARFARESNREVFAVPGSIHDEDSIGCNQLIRSQKAKILLEPNDIYEEFPQIEGISQADKEVAPISFEFAQSPTLAKKVYQVFRKRKSHTITSLNGCNLADDEQLLGVLMELECHGLISKSIDGSYSIN